jgi:hypothetical protein
MIMKISHRLFACLLLLAAGPLPGLAQGSASSSLPPMTLLDAGGRRYFDNWVNEVEGTAFFKDGWGKGYVVLKSGRRFNDVVLQVDLYRQQVYFQHQGATYSFHEPVVEAVIQYPDDTDRPERLFRTGYPSAGSHNASTVYEVLADGSRLQLLAWHGKNLVEKTNYGGAAVKQFVAETQYWLYDVASKLLVPVDKKTDLTLLSGLPARCNPKGRPRNTEDWIKLVQCANAR